jgi:3'-phosphoadenosine 5'-phosphosulfate sulfotransferase (PAPS reductase)/FAD synthetase
MAPDLTSYDKIIVAFSTGKDSLACVLDLIERGAPRDRIELWHHDIDGREGDRLMDWPCTPGYGRAIAAELGLPILFSWRAGGFEGEMTRQDSPSGPVLFETLTDDGVELMQARNRPTNGTRQQYPQVSPDLSVRWCSAYLKIDVARRALANDPRFAGKRILFVTGERAEESTNRARYAEFEPHAADLRDGKRVQRHIDAYRPVLRWKAAEVWAIIERHRIQPHPCYVLGIGRASCAFCIFASASQLAIAAAILPEQFERNAAYEARWGKTIHRTESLIERIARGDVGDLDPIMIAQARSEEWTLPIIVENWTMPAGAFAETHGPS